MQAITYTGPSRFILRKTLRPPLALIFGILIQFWFLQQRLATPRVQAQISQKAKSDQYINQVANFYIPV